MICVNSSVGPKFLDNSRFVLEREAGTLIIFVKRSHEDPLVTPTLRGVLDKGPVWDLLTQVVSDDATLVDGGETYGQDEDTGDEDDEEHDNEDGEDSHQGRVGLLKIIVIVLIQQRTKGAHGVYPLDRRHAFK